MPEFPRYQSKGALTTQTPAAPAAEDTSGKIMELGAKVGTDIANAGAKIQETQQSVQDAGLQLEAAKLRWNNALKSTRKTVASVNQKTALLDLEQRAEQEVDPAKQAQYTDELQKINQKSVDGLDPVSALELNYDAKVSEIKLDSMFKKKSLVLDKIATQDAINLEINNPTQASYGNIKKLLAEKVATGHMTPDDADKMYKDSVKTIGSFEVANDPATQESDSNVLAELRKGDEGQFKDIPPDDRLELIKSSQSRIFNNNQTYKRDITDSQNERSNGLIDKFAAGEVTIQDIENEESIPEESGGMKRSQLLTYKKAVLGGIKNNLDRMLQEKTPDHDPTQRAKAVKDYLDLVDNFMDSKSDQWHAKEKLAEAYADGIVNPREQKFLNGLKQNLKDIEFNRNTGIVAGAIKQVKNFFGQNNAPDEEIARQVKTLVGGIAEGKDPQVMAKQVMDAQMKQYFPDLTTYPKTGKLKRDRNGHKYLIFPDGTWADAPGDKSK